MIGDKALNKTAQAARRDLTLTLVTAVSLTDAVLWEWLPGFAGWIVDVQLNNRVTAGAATVKVRVGGANFAAGRSAITDLVAVTASRQVAVLSTTLANRRFTSAEVIRVGITTDGTGALTNGILTITVRPLLGGEY
jgi:hypothetical protein